MPAQPKLAIPSKLCLRTYLAAERYGVVWVCLSPEPRQPLPDWPQLEDPKLKQINMGPLPWKCSAPRHTENFNDLAHLSWVHAGTFGNRDKPEVEKYEVETRPGGAKRPQAHGGVEQPIKVGAHRGEPRDGRNRRRRRRSQARAPAQPHERRRTGQQAAAADRRRVEHGAIQQPFPSRL